eukprot:8713613-Alexandrium_andersonii.AAC.1
MQVRVWCVEQAVGLGNGARIAILGDWNEEPNDGPVLRWAEWGGWAALSPGGSTRWTGKRCIDWG